MASRKNLAVASSPPPTMLATLTADKREPIPCRQSETHRSLGSTFGSLSLSTIDTTWSSKGAINTGPHRVEVSPSLHLSTGNSFVSPVSTSVADICTKSPLFEKINAGMSINMNRPTNNHANVGGTQMSQNGFDDQMVRINSTMRFLLDQQHMVRASSSKHHTANAIGANEETAATNEKEQQMILQTHQAAANNGEVVHRSIQLANTQAALYPLSSRSGPLASLETAGDALFYASTTFNSKGMPNILNKGRVPPTWSNVAASWCKGNEYHYYYFYHYYRLLLQYLQQQQGHPPKDQWPGVSMDTVPWTVVNCLWLARTMSISSVASVTDN